MITGRLAPTPSGALHLGNVVAFAAAWLSVRQRDGRLLLRIEDVDRGRSRTEHADSIRRDLAWLGLTWDSEVPPQSARDYAPIAARLDAFTYFCTCTRRVVRQAGGLYPGTCRELGHTHGALRLRLDPGKESFIDRRHGPQSASPSAFGDPVLRTRSGDWAYNLAVVADDIADGVTEVVRGADLLHFTTVQLRLWRLLGGAPPTWLHTPVVLGRDGRKLSKSEGAQGVEAWRRAGRAPAEVWRIVLPWLGIEHDDLHAAIQDFRADGATASEVKLPELPLL